MQSDLTLIRHSFPEEITIYPIADVHLGAVEHCADAWDDFIKKLYASNAYVILVGDLLNNVLRSTGFSNPYDEAMRPSAAKRAMVKYLEPIRDRILCVVTGNHERRTNREADQDITYDICSKLDLEDLYRENIAYMAIGVGQRPSEDKAVCNYVFAVTHGAGGGIYTGAAVNRDERFGNVIDGLDCLVTGHVHKGFITKPAKVVIDPRNNQVIMRHYVVVSCVPWLNYCGYAAQKMLLPAQACDPQSLKLTVDKSHKKRIITTW